MTEELLDEAGFGPAFALGGEEDSFFVLIERSVLGMNGMKLRSWLTFF